MHKCLACGVEKDLSILEIYPYEDGMITTERPIPPLLIIECSPPKDSSGMGYRAIIVCHNCFYKLDPDMWISYNCWQTLHPITKFEELPKLNRKLPGNERWNPVNYPECEVLRA